MTTRITVICTLALGLSATANAWVYVGNPKVSILVDRPAGDFVSGVVVLERVRIHKCGGGYIDHAVNETIDPVSGWDLAIDSGNYCGVSFDWDSTMTVEGDDWTVEYDEAVTSVTLDGTATVWTGLTPYTVTEGEYSGSPPRLYVTVE